jgi:hypothetical protein
MHEAQHLPVVGGSEVVGMISLADIAFQRPDDERGSLDARPPKPQGVRPFIPVGKRNKTGEVRATIPLRDTWLLTQLVRSSR